MAKLTNLDVSFISLVKNPANKKDIVYKSMDKYNITKSISIKKHDKGLIYGTVYEPEKKDAEGDWADLETIRKAAHNFLMNGKQLNVDTEHNEKKTGASIVESYVNDTGWGVVLKTNPEGELFQKVKKGDYSGLSMMGVAIKKNEEPKSKEDDNVKQEIEDLKKSIETLTAIVKNTPQSKQIEFDKDGNIITKNSDDEPFSELKFLEV